MSLLEIETAEMVGLLATLFTIVAFLPQVWQVWKTRETKDISLATFLFLLAGALSWLTYGLMIWSRPVIITNSTIAVLQTTIIAFKLRYG